MSPVRPAYRTAHLSRFAGRCWPRSHRHRRRTRREMRKELRNSRQNESTNPERLSCATTPQLQTNPVSETVASSGRGGLCRFRVDARLVRSGSRFGFACAGTKPAKVLLQHRQRRAEVQCLCHLLQAPDCVGVFQKNPAALELRVNPKMLPSTDRRHVRMRCSVRKCMKEKRKARVASDRQGLSPPDPQANGVT